VIPAVYLFPESSSYHLELELPVTDRALKPETIIYLSGPKMNTILKMNIKASIYGVPKKLEKIVVVTYKDASQVGISAIDLESNVEHVVDITSDFALRNRFKKQATLYCRSKSCGYDSL